jgi:ABC-type Fe3+/spermidine/putrescine transport system ATPase subunit
VLEAAGASWIVVTHDEAEAGVMAQRLVRMDAGRI